jgi:hypothetical protein
MYKIVGFVHNNMNVISIIVSIKVQADWWFQYVIGVITLFPEDNTNNKVHVNHERSICILA